MTQRSLPIIELSRLGEDHGSPENPPGYNFRGPQMYYNRN